MCSERGRATLVDSDLALSSDDEEDDTRQRERVQCTADGRQVRQSVIHAAVVRCCSYINS